MTIPPGESLKPTDQAAVVLERTRELMWTCHELAAQLAATPDGYESSSGAAERLAYGVLVAVLEQGLVETLERMTDVLQRFSTLAGLVG